MLLKKTCSLYQYPHTEYKIHGPDSDRFVTKTVMRIVSVRLSVGRIEGANRILGADDIFSHHYVKINFKKKLLKIHFAARCKY